MPRPMKTYAELHADEIILFDEWEEEEEVTIPPTLPSGLGASSTPLWMASELGHTKVVRLLLENGADPQVTDHFGYPCIYVSAMRNQFDVVVELLNCGVNVNQPTRTQETPLMIAALNNNVALVNLLIEHHASIHHVNNDGHTALSFAAKGNAKECVRALLRAGADPNHLSKQGHTPLMYAVIANSVEIVRMLIAEGADSSIINDYHRCAWDYCRDLSILREFG